METKQSIEVTCPDCRGPLSELQDGGPPQYRCLVGHLYSAYSILQAHSEAEEKALWAAVVALEESVTLARFAGMSLPATLAARIAAQADFKRQQARDIRAILQRLEPFDLR
jgi:two-component system chemotaxis response regulator CheB